MNLEDAVRARRSVRAFLDKPVPRAALERAVSLAVQAPAPHHSRPWRFVILEDQRRKEELSRAMGAAWRQDLASDGLTEDEIERIVGKSHRLLVSTPTLVVCCAQMSRAHSYPDPRRRRAEWSLFAHSVGAALQTFMTSLAEEEIGSCWISAPVFCGEIVKQELGLDPSVEPHALVLVGYASPDYEPRPRPEPDPREYIVFP
ncbi:MAG: nitroreductase family protein [Actinomycetota bacterium]|nr:nitroreductase family protein [Actinomycetota bacterium]